MRGFGLFTKRAQKVGFVYYSTFAAILALVLSAGGIFLAVPTAATLQSLGSGMEAPDFSVKDLSGQQRNFASVKGTKLTVIVFWSTWSVKSDKALARMETLYEKYKDKGVNVLAIDVDGQTISDQTQSDIRGHVKKLGLTYPVAIDHGLVTFHDYGVIAVPSTVVLDPDRMIKYELSGFPLLGSEDLISYISNAAGGRKEAAQAAQKTGYQPDHLAVRYFNMGRKMLKSRRMSDTAELWFKKAIEKDPEFIQPHISLGKFYLARGNVPAAKEQFQTALSKEPANVAAMCELGMILYGEGKAAEGKDLMQKAIKIEEAYTPCYYYLGYVSGKEGNQALASKMFDSAAKLNPMDPQIYIYKGKLAEETKNFPQAAEAYKKALQVMLKL